MNRPCIFKQHEGSRSRTGNRESLFCINLSLSSKWYFNTHYTYKIPFTTLPHNVSLRFRVITFRARSIHYFIIYGKLTYIHIYVYRHQGWQKGNETKALGPHENDLLLGVKIFNYKALIIVTSNIKIKNHS